MNPIAILAGFSVRRWQFTVLVFGMLVALGVSSWFAIPRAEDPQFPVPVYTTVAVLPGATPEDMEQLVTDPIERRIKALENIDKLYSRSSDGVAAITVEFDPDVDADRKYDEVVREVNALQPDLPEALTQLEVRQNKNADIAVLQLALVSPSAPYPVLDDEAERITDALGRIAGVRAAEHLAVPGRELQVSLDLDKLGALGIPVTQVMQALQGDNVQIPGGSVDVGRRRFNIVPPGRFASPNEVRGTVIGAGEGRILRIGDVADVAWGDADAVHLGRFNGERAVFLTVAAQEGENVSSVRDRVYAELDRLETTLPEGVVLARGFDQARNVESRLSRLQLDFLIALALVLITLLPLGTRASVIVMIAIPLSLAIAVALLAATGFTINQLSIVGFVIALGLLVDDSIVVVENITRFLRSGMSRRQAAVEGTKQIGVAVVGSTATLVLAFLPLLFLPGLSGRYIRSLPVSVTYAVLASTFVAVTIIPWLASRLLPRTEAAEGNRFLQALTGAIRVTYAPLLERSLAAPRRTLLAAGLLVVASLALVPAVGFSLFPKAGTPQVRVDVSTPQGASLAETDAAVRHAERVLLAHPSVRAVFANIGKDNPVVYYNVFQRPEAPNRAQLFVLLTEYDGTATPRMLDSLRTQLAAWPGAKIELKEFENGPPIDAPIAMRLEGPALDTLRTLAAQVERVLETTPGTQYVNNPIRLDRTDLRVDVDRAKAGLLGVPGGAIDPTIRLGIVGLEVGDVRGPDGDDHPLVARLARDGRPTPDALDRIRLGTVTGTTVPLAQLAATRFETSPTVVEHFDRQRAVTVTSNVREGFNTAAVTDVILARLDSLALPVGYALVPAGEIESREESFGGIGAAIIVAVFGILAVLVLEFRDFRTTLVVASVIPLGVVGGIAALFLTGYTLSFTAMIGFVALLGIEIKTSILLVDLTDQLRRSGTPLEEAIRTAGEVRFVPIVLTALTAVGGLLPLALQGSGLYSPLAWVIIGGLVSSTLFARLVTPVMYKLLAPPLVDAEDVADPAAGTGGAPLAGAPA